MTGHLSRMAVVLLIAASLFLFDLKLSLADPIITNGSFEAVPIGSPFVSSNSADVPGWAHGGPVGDGLLWAIGYADPGGSVRVAGAGNQFVTLGGGFIDVGTANWSTTITGLAVGSSYNVDFMIASEFPATQTMTVGFLSGSSTASQSFTASPSSDNYWRTWVPEMHTFLASGTSAVINFSVNNQGFDMGLDNVTVTSATTAVPEPSSLLMAALGLTGLAVRWWRNA